MQMEARRPISIGTLCARMRLLLNLFAYEGTFPEGRDWPFAVENLLFPAACVSRVETDTFAADLYGSWSYCSPAAEYDERQSIVLNDYMSALARFHFVWNAYETARKTSEAGGLLTSRNAGSRKALVERIPGMHRRLVERVYRTSMSLVGRDEAILKRLKKGKEVLNLGEAGLLAAGFRDYVFHGHEAPPEPDDWDDRFANAIDGSGVVSLQSYRVRSFTRLTLHLIQALTHAELQRLRGVEAGDVPFLSHGEEMEFEVPCGFLVNLATFWPEEPSLWLPTEAIEQCAIDCGVSENVLRLMVDAGTEPIHSDSGTTRKE